MTQQINLFNPIFLRQKKYFCTVTILQALALLMVGVLSFYGYAWYQTKALSKEVDEVGKKLDAEQKRLASLTGELGPRKKSQELEQQIKELEKQLREREEILGIQTSSLDSGGRGFSEYLRALARQSVNGLWLTNISIRDGGNRLFIGGKALRPELVPDYLKRLGKERVMQGQTFSSLGMRVAKIVEVGKGTQRDGYFEFALNSGEQEIGQEETARVR